MAESHRFPRHVLHKQAVAWWEVGDARCWRLPHPVCVLFGRNVAHIAKSGLQHCQEEALNSSSHKPGLMTGIFHPVSLYR